MKISSHCGSLGFVGASAVRTITASLVGTQHPHTDRAAAPPLIALPNTVVYVPTCRLVLPPALGSSCSDTLVALSVTPGVSSSIVTVTCSVTVTGPLGWAFRATVYALPSATVTACGLTDSPASSSVTVKVLSEAGSNPLELEAFTTSCVIVTSPLIALASSSAATAIACAPQFDVVKLRLWDAPAVPPALFTVVAPLPLVTHTSTFPAGAKLSPTVHVALVPSATESLLRLNTVFRCSQMNSVDDIYVTGVGITVTYKDDGAPAVAAMVEVGVTFTLEGGFPSSDW